VKRRRVLWAALGLLALLAAAGPLAYYLRAKLAGEHFYRGRPTNYWSNEIQRWDKRDWSEPWPDRLLKGRFTSAAKLVRGSEGVPILNIGAPAVLEDASPAVFPVLRDLVKDEKPAVRLHALTRLAAIDLDSDATVAALFAGLGDKEPKVRFLAAVKLGELRPGGGDVILALSHALGDSSVEVRHRAVYSLVNLGPEAALPLVRALDDPEKHIRQIAWYSLRKCGGGAKPAVPQLVEMALKEDDKDVRSIAAWVLEDIDPEAARLAGIARP
jgi:HEAT repeat protein